MVIHSVPFSITLACVFIIIFLPVSAVALWGIHDRLTALLNHLNVPRETSK